MAIQVDGFTLAKKGLEIQGEPSKQAWLAMGRELIASYKATSFALGDWLNYGVNILGVKAEDIITEHSMPTFRVYCTVARRVAFNTRRARLSFQHHLEVSRLDQAEQQLWLSRAERQKWPAAKLREKIRGLRPVVAEPYAIAVDCADESMFQIVTDHLDGLGVKWERLKHPAKAA